jgi:hypothetical protein
LKKSSLTKTEEEEEKNKLLFTVAEIKTFMIVGRDSEESTLKHLYDPLNQYM